MIMVKRKQEGDGATRFTPGELVRHRRYGYRGVVVACDTECKASDEWYQSNQSQPPRDRPWYHVLVDGSHQTTYAAEENLETDHGGGPIEHPLLQAFFSEFTGDYYVRNERPWPID